MPLFLSPASSQPAPLHRSTRARNLSLALGVSLGLALGLSATASAQTLLVSSEKDNQLAVLAADGSLKSTIAVCKRPRHMLLHEASGKVLVACGDSHQLGVVDVASGKMTDTLPTGESPEIFALSPDGKTVYVSIEEDN